MPFRSDLDLSAILPKHSWDQDGQKKEKPWDEPRPKPRVKPAPIRFGAGATVVSSSKELEPFPSVCWDVNGYYRELGVDWKATKKELMEAYQSTDGPNDARLTYVFRQLIQKEVREEYDRMPFGSVFMDDYVQAEILSSAKKEAARRTNLGQWSDSDEILNEWGFVFIPEDEELEEEPFEDLTNEAPSARIVDVGGENEPELWPYSFFKLGTFKHSREPLVEWQNLLLEELSGHSVKFAVGWSKAGSGFKIHYHNGVVIFFLQEDSTPTKRIAEMAVKTFLFCNMSRN